LFGNNTRIIRFDNPLRIFRTKNVIFVFLLAQTFLKKKALPKKQGFSFLRSIEVFLVKLFLKVC
ncbi:hypothetical protein C5S35_02425, partial [Candidatus Methanophagaceae archaeon]